MGFAHTHRRRAMPVQTRSFESLLPITPLPAGRRRELIRSGRQGYAAADPGHPGTLLPGTFTHFPTG